MSLDIQVYTKQLSDDLIPQILKRLNDHDMIVEVHPEFSFTNQTGFLPFKFILTNTSFSSLTNIELISGFELYVDGFNLSEEKKKLNPKQSFLNKLFGKKQEEVEFASSEIENQLKDCTKELLFNWGVSDYFENRFALLTSAILTELTHGVLYDPQEDMWYDAQNIVDNVYKEVIAFESSVKEHELVFYKFEGWN